MLEAWGVFESDNQWRVRVPWLRKFMMEGIIVTGKEGK